ncbi:MAG: FkbM family methyltransferase [Candidatus Micrarchaeota archaeon]|nr:FkbM family methyltransferase [Candidatus Micrarchaeota archaeon]
MARYSHRMWQDLKVFVRDPKAGFRLLYELRVRAGRYNLLKETFMVQPYIWLAKRLRPNTTLIDIGANIGDTAIYFAMSDRVRKVIAYEPMPYTFSEARHNVDMSPYKSKVTLVNKAVSYNAGSKRIDADMLGSSASDFNEMPESGRGTMVSSVTLQEALKGLSNVAIKCDCEGAERTLFSNVDLSKVYAIQVEYHDCLPEVVGALRQKGFKTTSKGTKEMGMVYATR